MAMNRKVSKLLSKYAVVSEQKIDHLKKWWNTLSWQEKTRERIRIEKQLSPVESEEAETGEKAE